MLKKDKKLSIAVLGAGMSGMCMGIKLRAQGYENFTIFEKADNVGGTWRENTYPGVSCDVPSHLYSYSFARNPDWSKSYSGGQEIQAYCEKIAEDYDILPYCKFNQEVKAIRYEKGQWHIEFKNAGAQNHALCFDVVVTAIGGLHTPIMPEIEGKDSFSGSHFHTAEWDHSVDLTGKKVVIIGSAASAVQVVPNIVDNVSSLNIFQRTPNWMFPRLNNVISKTSRRLMRLFPFLSYLRRQWIFLASDYILHPAFKEKNWMQKRLRRQSTDYIEETVTDLDLRKKLIPNFPLGCKRILFVEGYLEALQRPHVTLSTQGISKITPEGILDKDGVLHAADVLIYATGFEPFNFLDSLSVTGENNLSLKQVWQERISSHRTVGAAGFANFFMLLGPNSGLGHSSIIVMIEAQVNYIMQCLEHIQTKGLRRFMPKPSNQDAFTQRIQAGLKGTVWNGNCASWYKRGEFGDTSHNHTIWPFSSRQYVHEMSHLELSEYESEANTPNAPNAPNAPRTSETQNQP